MSHFQRSRVPVAVASALLAGLAAAGTASADSIIGNVSFTGDVVFAAPIPGITLDDLTVSTGPGITATGNGEDCEILSNGSAPVDGAGLYPQTGTLTAQIEISRGGNNVPDDSCLIQLRASGNDGADVSASGTVTVEVTAAQIDADATVAASTITVRQSKVIAGVDTDCLKYLKKQTKFRGKCNAALWKYGGTEGAEKCKTEPEPMNCDPTNYVEAVVALSFGNMDQQTDPPSAVAIDLEVAAEQAKCQRYIGKGAANFWIKRNQYVNKLCVLALNDTPACRATATSEARARLSVIDNCVADQVVDTNTSLQIAHVDEPCLSQAFTGLTLDRKLLKDCLELELSTLSDGVIGDVPECGNGVVQAGEQCDDGNVASGDCCSSTCAFEAAGSQTCGTGACEVTTAQCSMGEPVTCTPGTPGNEALNCMDGIDNDCDNLIDFADSLDCM